MTVYGRIFLAGLGSGLILAGALFFQYVLGLAPCPLCIWQRWPHLAAVVLAILAMTILWRICRRLAGLGALVMLGSAGLGIYHTGVERAWWPGPGTCSAPGDPGGLTAGALLDQILATPLVRCDEVAWDLLSLSMASWNAVLSLVLVAIWFWAAITPALQRPKAER